MILTLILTNPTGTSVSKDEFQVPELTTITEPERVADKFYDTMGLVFQTHGEDKNIPKTHAHEVFGRPGIV